MDIIIILYLERWSSNPREMIVTGNDFFNNVESINQQGAMEGKNAELLIRLVISEALSKWYRCSMI